MGNHRRGKMLPVIVALRSQSRCLMIVLKLYDFLIIHVEAQQGMQETVLKRHVRGQFSMGFA
jgi:hypothetical protein